MALHRIGNYELLGELGRGGMGVVYRGVDSFIKRPVAIKTIYLSEIQDDQERQFLRERLYREAQSAGILSHPNIVTIYQIGEQDEITYIAMEFVDGPNLAEVLRKRDQGKVSLESLVAIFEQTASGLDHAHSQGVIHRDIKPANIIVRNDGVAKITDFGVAKISSQTVTRTGMTLGTPHFMAPEQIQGKKLDGRADQYSLGVVMYESITGKRPFTADSMTTLIFKIVSDPVDPKRDNPNISDAASEVLKRALAKRAEDRYPTCEALARAFREAVGMGSVTGAATGSFAAGFQAGAASTQPYSTATAFPQGSGAFPPPATGSTGFSAGLGTVTPTGIPYGQPPAATPVPTPSVAPMPMPPVPPATRNAPPVPTPQPVSDWRQPTPSYGTNPPVSTATPVPRRNHWLAPLLVVLGLALVAGIFGIFKLLTGGQSTADGSKTTTEIAGLSRPEGTGGSGDTRGSAAPGDAASASQSQAPGTSGSPLTAPPASTPSTSPSPAAGMQQPASGAGVAASGAPAAKPPASRIPGGSSGVTSPSIPVPVPSAVKEPTARPATPKPVVPAVSEPVNRPAEPVAPVAEPAPAASTAATPTVTSAPRPLVRVPAVYPAAARREGVSGTVSLRTLVNTAGEPTNIEVVKGIRPDLDTAARQALAKWRFQPGTADGKPIEARVNVEITFNLVQDSRKPVSLRNP
ncbi:MAG: TonB family protein [Bryobacterales bacterium]|nr:TonB family protein [Bryobacterales bacterium]